MNESVLNICVLIAVLIIGGIAIYHKCKHDNAKDDLARLARIIKDSAEAMDWYYDQYHKYKTENQRLKLYIRLYDSNIEITPDIEMILKEIEENG